jgi:hypothetical protein
VEREYGVLREAENVVYATNARLARLYLSPEEMAGAPIVEDAAQVRSSWRP